MIFGLGSRVVVVLAGLLNAILIVCMAFVFLGEFWGL